MKICKFFIISFGLFSTYSLAFAAPDCSDYIPGINKQFATYLSFNGPAAKKYMRLNEYGERIGSATQYSTESTIDRIHSFDTQLVAQCAHGHRHNYLYQWEGKSAHLNRSRRKKEVARQPN